MVAFFLLIEQEPLYAHSRATEARLILRKTLGRQKVDRELDQRGRRHRVDKPAGDQGSLCLCELTSWKRGCLQCQGERLSA